MSRIFNIYFTFCNRNHNAMVAEHKKDAIVEYELKMLDEELERNLPSTKIVTTKKGALKFIQPIASYDKLLISSILQAISSHINLIKVYRVQQQIVN